MKWLDIFKHLLPNARAWRVTIDKALRRFFEGLVGLPASVVIFFDNIWNDLRPHVTRELNEWESQFALRDTGLTDQQRRDRLDATWKALGGQDPRYIQDTLQGAGFNVYVHEWWPLGGQPLPGVKACATPRNPLTVLRREFTGAILMVDCGEPLAQCGEAFAESGNSVEPRGYPLVNKVFVTEPDLITLCGEIASQAGEIDASCGNFLIFKETLRQYIVPSDPTKWPYFLYIGAQTFGDIAQVDPKRRDEFEALCLKICPAQQWLGILVEYV